MALLEVLSVLLGGVFVLVATAGAAFVDGERVKETVRNPMPRVRAIAPHLLVLGAVLAANRTIRHVGQKLSWVIGWNITGLIYAVEGRFVVAVQSIASPALTVVFSFAYVFGYAFLVTFPLLAYVVLEDVEPIRKTLLAYALNYALGLVCYTLFIAYGPRNLLTDAVQGLLFSSYPRVQLLMSTVNTNTNVFPSLHTSLSVTVALLARRTRNRYPGWYVLAVVLSAAVVFSTMYLGIHWASDVVAGAVLAVVSVRLAGRYQELRILRGVIPDRFAPGDAETRRDD